MRPAVLSYSTVMAATFLPSDIATEKRRRLQQLEGRAARLGYNTPPEVANEIQDLRRELAGDAPATVAESYRVLYDQVLSLRDDVRRIYWLMPILMLLLCGFMVLLVKL